MLREYLLTLGKLPAPRQQREFTTAVTEALQGNLSFRNHPEKEGWLASLFPLFLKRWGQLPLAQLPISRLRHPEIIQWLRQELLLLQEREAETREVRLVITGPQETFVLVTRLAVTVQEIIAIVRTKTHTSVTSLYYDGRELSPHLTLFQQKVLPHIPLICVNG